MEIAIVILGVIILVQALERYYVVKDLTTKLNDSIKAVMSRNINEYIAATTIPKQTTEKVESEDVQLSEATDDEFLKAIGIKK